MTGKGGVVLRWAITLDHDLVVHGEYGHSYRNRITRSSI